VLAVYINMWLCTANVRVILSHYYHIRQRFPFISLYSSIVFVNCCLSVWRSLIWCYPKSSSSCRSSRNGDILSITRDWQSKSDLDVGHRGQHNLTAFLNKNTNKLDLNLFDDVDAATTRVFCFFSLFSLFSCFKFRWIATTTCFLVYKCTVKLHSLYISPSKITHSFALRMLFTKSYLSLYQNNAV